MRLHSPFLVYRVLSTGLQAMRAWSVPKLYTEDVWAASRPFDAAVYYAAAGSRRLRIGVLTDDRFFTPATACLRAVREAEAALRAAGHEVVAFTPSDHGLDTYKHALNYFAVMAADGGMRSYVNALRGEPLIPLYSKLHSIARLPNWLRPAIAGVLRASGKPRMADLCLYATGKSAYELWLKTAEARVYREAYIAAMRAAGIDIILCPGFGLPATPHGASGDLSVAASWCVRVFYHLAATGGVECGRRQEELLHARWRVQGPMDRLPPLRKHIRLVFRRTCCWEKCHLLSIAWRCACFFELPHASASRCRARCPYTFRHTSVTLRTFFTRCRTFQFNYLNFPAGTVPVTHVRADEAR